MSIGRTIKLYLVDGTPSGIITAEIMNWTGHALVAPRTRIADLIQREEVRRTGIYFLVGHDPEDASRQMIYIGESDDVGKRLIQHNKDVKKEFWERACVITSKDQNLTKAHVRYIESRLIAIAGEIKRATLQNNTAPDYGYLPEPDIADMEFFIEQIRTVLPVLSMDYLRDKVKVNSVESRQELSTDKEKESPVFELFIKKQNLKSYAQEYEGDFVVLKGSKARPEWIGAHKGYKALHEQLCRDGVLVREGDALIFETDTPFTSPSAAAAVILGRPANGRTEWTTSSGGQTYADWQESQINSADSEKE